MIRHRPDRTTLPRFVNPEAPYPIVLVDDEKSYTDVLSLAIEESLQRPVVAFTRPLDALSALPRLQPPLIVTDYFMPQLNGLEFVRLAAAMLPRTPFVLISGHNLSGIALDIARLDAVKAVLAKPFSGRVLIEEILRVWPEHAPRPGAANSLAGEPPAVHR